MRKWKKAIAMLLGFCMLGGVTSVVEAKANVAWVSMKIGQTEILPVISGADRILIKVLDDRGTPCDFDAYFYSSENQLMGTVHSNPDWDPDNAAIPVVPVVSEYDRAECVGDYKSGVSVNIYRSKQQEIPPAQENPSGQETPPAQDNPSGNGTLPEQGTSSDGGGDILEQEAQEEQEERPYIKFNQDTTAAILNAENNENVIIDTDTWISFPQSVFDALSERPDVALTVKYRYEGKRYTVTIPSGSDVASLTDENGYCGFRYLDLKFGGSELTEG